MSHIIDDDDDDLYDPADAVPVTQSRDPQRPPADALNGSNDAEEEEEVEEEEEDDDDFNIITEAPADAPPPEVQHPRHATLRADSQRPTSADSSTSPRTQTQSIAPRVDSSASIPSGTRPVSQKPGSAYPPVQTSTIDVHANPIHPATGKPIMVTDMDVDFPEDDKPWRRPGTDLTDYFNYGFDEFTWASYVIKQQELRKEVGDQKRQLDDMQSFLTMGLPPMPGAQPAGPPANSAPPPMPGIPGMPDMNQDMMQGMLTSMMSQGLDPASMDPMSFMQHAQAMMGGQSGAGGGQQGQGGYGGQSGGQGQMGYGGGYGGGGGGRGRGRRW
ncbi:Fip1 motif-domain-containing protein [Aspergillus spectabilis]